MTPSKCSLYPTSDLPGYKNLAPLLRLKTIVRATSGFSQWLSSKQSTCNAGDMDSIPVLRRSPGGGHGNPLQYSYLWNSMDRGAWWAMVHRGCKESSVMYMIEAARHAAHTRAISGPPEHPRKVINAIEVINGTITFCLCLTPLPSLLCHRCQFPQHSFMDIVNDNVLTLPKTASCVLQSRNVYLGTIFFLCSFSSILGPEHPW